MLGKEEEMKTISVLGKKNNTIRMFILELAWVLSKDKKVYCHLSDKEFYDRFSENDLDSTDIGELSIVNNLDEIPKDDDSDTFLLSEDYIEGADTCIFAVEQDIFSINMINEYAKKDKLGEIVFAYIDFISSSYDEHYLKTYFFDKRLVDNMTSDFYFEFDEKTRMKQVENQFNRIISLKKYPKGRKMDLLNMVEFILSSEKSLNYREYYKCLDGRVSIC